MVYSLQKITFIWWEVDCSNRHPRTLSGLTDRLPRILTAWPQALDCFCWVKLRHIISMTSRNKWVIIKPIRRISHAALTSDCSARRALSTKSEGTRALTVPKLSHRLRRLAKAYPDAIGAVSSTAVEDSRIAGVMNANDEEVRVGMQSATVIKDERDWRGQI